MNSPFEPPTGEPVWPSSTPAHDRDHDHGRRRRNRRHTAIGMGAGLLGGGAVGLLMVMPSFSSAATTATTDTTVVVDDTSANTTETTDVADVPAVAEVSTRLREALQPLVEDGTITAAQADAVATQLADSFPRGGRGGGGHHGHGGRGFDGEVLAGLLGIDVETLRTELASGSTIAEIATAHGVDVQVVIDGLVTEASTRLDAAVANGRITQEEADSKLAELTAKITDRVNNGRPERGAEDIDDAAEESGG